MNTKAFFPCGGGSNLILGVGRENQIFVYQMGKLYKAFLHLFVGGWVHDGVGEVGGWLKASWGGWWSGWLEGSWGGWVGSGGVGGWRVHGVGGWLWGG